MNRYEVPQLFTIANAVAIVMSDNGRKDGVGGDGMCGNLHYCALHELDD